MPLQKMRLTGLTRAAIVGVVLVGIAAAAMLIARRAPSVLAKMTATQSQPQNDATATPAAQQVTPAPKTKRVSAGQAPAAARVQAKQTAPSPAGAATPAARPALVMAAATAPAAEPPANAAAQASAPVTITGCLEEDEGTFRLKDTMGANAPKARSWKSGFLKKRSASIEVVDAANRLRLPTHVGQRVSITGVLDDREMRARVVQRVGQVCS